MTRLTWRTWIGLVVVTMLVATCTWIGLNLGKMLYADWAFLHTVRVNSERAAQQPPPPQGK